MLAKVLSPKFIIIFIGLLLVLYFTGILSFVLVPIVAALLSVIAIVISLLGGGLKAFILGFIIIIVYRRVTKKKASPEMNSFMGIVKFVLQCLLVGIFILFIIDQIIK